jgi:hypothetical protein
MKTTTTLAIAALASLCGLNAFSQETAKPKKTPAQTVAATKPGSDEAPIRTIVEEDFWFPLRYAPMQSFDGARYDYRRSEEKSAAYEINKAVSWLGWAERRAMPETQAKLTEAATELKAVSKDLQSGNMYSAAKLDASLSKAAIALSEWHYYRAKDWWGKDDAKHAGDDLVMAANYLQRAADSAHYQFGPDSQEVISEVFRNGKWINDEKHTDHNWIAKNIEGVESGLREIAASLKK